MKIYDITKCLSGNVLGIGVDENITEIIKENDLITNCNLLNSSTKGKTSSNKKQKKEKQIRIKKLRKVFKKKKIDYTLCNIEEVKKYLKTFIRDSIYINKKIIYMYNINDTELKEELIKKYNRYNTNIEVIKDKNNEILKIDTQQAKTNKIKDIYYSIIDTIIKGINFIGDILMN